MINKIIDGISVAIGSEFGNPYEIYTEPIEQGLIEPCFSILCLNPTIDQKLGNRYFRRNQFCVHYFPSSNEKQSECYSVAERLMNVLEIITVDGDLCRGTNMEYQVVDGVLSFLVNYNMYAYKETETKTSMGDLTHNRKVKG